MSTRVKLPEEHYRKRFLDMVALKAPENLQKTEKTCQTVKQQASYFLLLFRKLRKIIRTTVP